MVYAYGRRSFVLFMVLSDSKVTDFLSSQQQNVGSVDDEDVTYQEYSVWLIELKNQEEASNKPLMKLKWIFQRSGLGCTCNAKIMDKK